MIVCNGQATQNFKCTTVMRGQGYLLGIALNPSHGYVTINLNYDFHRIAVTFTILLRFFCRIMYITKDDNTIMKADMDGANSRTIVTGLGHPCGIAIDSSSSRLYWADVTSKSIKSCDLDGSNVVTVVQLSGYPYGIAVAPQRLYWGLWSDKKVQSSTMTRRANRPSGMD